MEISPLSEINKSCRQLRESEGGGKEKKIKILLTGSHVRVSKSWLRTSSQIERCEDTNYPSPTIISFDADRISTCCQTSGTASQLRGLLKQRSAGSEQRIVLLLAFSALLIIFCSHLL